MEVLVPQEEFVHVSVENPTIRNTYDEGRYVTYDVILQTNSLSFTSKQSVVQRRYSEFQWLRRTLNRTTGGVIPSIPMGRKWFGVFNEDYLNKRQIVLTEFLQKIVKDTVLISNSAFHLFLQTELSPRDMDRLISLTSAVGQGRSMDSLDNAWKAYGIHAPRVPSRSSEAEISTLQRFNDERNLNTSQSVPVLPKPDGVAQNEMQHALEKSPPSSEVFVRNGSESNSDANGNSEVIGSFFVDNASARMRGNSLRRHVEDVEWNDWVVIEEEPEPHMTLKEQLEDLVEITNNLKPEEFTNVKWRIGDTSLSSTPSDDSPMSAFSRDGSSASLPFQGNVSTATGATGTKQYTAEEEENSKFRPNKPCCSHSSPSPSMSLNRHLKSTPNATLNEKIPTVNKKTKNETKNSNLENLSDSGQNKPLRKLVKIPRQAGRPVNKYEKAVTKIDKKESMDDVTRCDNSSEKFQNTVDNNKKLIVPSQKEVSDVQPKVVEDDETKEVSENICDNYTTAPPNDNTATVNSEQSNTLLTQDSKRSGGDKELSQNSPK